MKQFLISLTLIIVLFASCKMDPCLTKDQFVIGYEMFTDKVAKKHEKYTENDWEQKDEEMEKYVKECYPKHEAKLTAEEKKDFWIRYLKYNYERHGKNLMRVLKSDIESINIDIEDEINEIFENPEEDIKKIIREVYGDDIDKALDSFKAGIEEITDKIKEWLREDK